MRAPRPTLLLLAAIAAAAPPVAAQHVTFNPSLSLEQGYDDNVFYNANDQQSDSLTRFNADLPLRRESRTGFVDLRYRPSILRYSDFDGFDRDEHDLRIRWETESGPRNTFRVDGMYRKTQEYGEVASIDETDLFIGRRVERDRLRAAFDFEREQSARWSWGVNVSGSTTDYGPLLDSTDPSDLEPPEDKSDYGADLRATWAMSRTSRIGGRYGHREFDLDLSGEESSDTASFLFEKDFDERTSLELAVGGFHSTGTAANPGSPDDSRSGALVEFRFQRLYDRMRLTAVASHLPSAGGVFEGTATTSVVGVQLASLRTRQWRFKVAPRITRRDPSDETEGTRTTIGLLGELERAVSVKLAIRGRARWIDQSNDDPAIDDRQSFEAYIGLVWYPLGGTTLGG